MVKIVNGIIVSQLDNESGSSNSSSSDNNTVKIFGFKLPLWSIILLLLGSLFFGGMPGAMIVSIGFGVGYFLSSDGRSNTTQVSNSKKNKKNNSILKYCYLI